jgi:tripartite-type tricarboxylate transporter receptor subunit TctC
MIIATVGTWAVNPYLNKLPYDVLADFTPLIHIATTPGVMIVHPSVPARSVNDLIALARAKPMALTYGSAGIGGFGHMCAELFSLLTGAKMTHVPYKGSAPSLTDLMGGHIQVLFNSAIPTMPHMTSGRVRALATTGSPAMRTPLGRDSAFRPARRRASSNASTGKSTPSSSCRRCRKRRAPKARRSPAERPMSFAKS